MTDPIPDETELVAIFGAKLRDELAANQAQSSATSEARAPVELDQQSVGRLSRMDAIQLQAMALASDQRRQTRRLQLQAALSRMEKGEYGFCLSCEEFIGLKRLEFDPAIPLCVVCAQNLGR